VTEMLRDGHAFLTFTRLRIRINVEETKNDSVISEKVATSSALKRNK
jgi:hypothetical protein